MCSNTTRVIKELNSSLYRVLKFIEFFNEFSKLSNFLTSFQVFKRIFELIFEIFYFYFKFNLLKLLPNKNDSKILKTQLNEYYKFNKKDGYQLKHAIFRFSNQLNNFLFSSICNFLKLTICIKIILILNKRKTRLKVHSKTLISRYNIL